jgi:hypothetical protein
MSYSHSIYIAAILIILLALAFIGRITLDKEAHDDELLSPGQLVFLQQFSAQIVELETPRERSDFFFKEKEEGADIFRPGEILLVEVDYNHKEKYKFKDVGVAAWSGSFFGNDSYLKGKGHALIENEKVACWVIESTTSNVKTRVIVQRR